jgi:hypothetical protein
MAIFDYGDSLYGERLKNACNLKGVHIPAYKKDRGLLGEVWERMGTASSVDTNSTKITIKHQMEC